MGFIILVNIKLQRRIFKSVKIILNKKALIKNEGLEYFVMNC